jgi:hypothetical protein
MKVDSRLRLSWTRVGGICGLLGIVAYIAAAFVPLPDFFSYLAAFAFGPLLAVACVGLYYGLASDGPTALIQIAAASGVAAGVAVLIMLTTQQAIFGVMESTINRAVDPASADTYRKVEHGLNAVHYGIDVAWDVLISIAVILFGIAMIQNRLFGKVLGVVGTLLGALLLGFNLWHFPIPPASAGSIDFGPFVAIWMLVSFVVLLRTSFRLKRDAA